MARYDGIVGGVKNLINRVTSGRNNEEEGLSLKQTTNVTNNSATIQSPQQVSTETEHIKQPGIKSALSSLEDAFKSGLEFGEKKLEDRTNDEIDKMYGTALLPNEGIARAAGLVVGTGKKWGNKLVGWGKKVPEIAKAGAKQLEYNYDIAKDANHLVVGYQGGSPLELKIAEDTGIGRGIGKITGLTMFGNNAYGSNAQFEEDINLLSSVPQEQYDDYLDKMWDKYKDQFVVEEINKGINYPGLNFDYDIDDDTKNELKNSGLKKGQHTVTKDEFEDYINLYTSNKISQYNIAKESGLTSDDIDDSIDLTQSINTDIKKQFMDTVNAGVSDAMYKKLNPDLVGPATLYLQQAMAEQFNRHYVEAEPILLAEQAIREKPQSEWTDADKYTIGVANKVRQILQATAEGYNDWALQTINASNDGTINYSLESFDNGEDLATVLGGKARKIYGLSDNDYYGHRTSTLDILQQINENWNYTSRDLVGKANRYDDIGHFFAGAGQLFSEAGQEVKGGLMRVRGAGDRNAYIDQDFNIGTLFRTDYSLGKRTRKTYYRELGEYVPEIVGNLAPDMLLTTVTEGGSIPLVLKNANRLTKLKNLGKIRKISKELKAVDNAVERTKLASNITELSTSGLTRRYANQPAKWKLGAELVDKFITRGIVDTAINGQFNTYDTEAYSTPSDIINIGGTVLTEWLPLTRQFQLGKLIKGAGNVNLGTREASVWDLADYIDSSPEAKEYMVGLLGKELSTATSQEIKSLVDGFGDIMEATKQVYDSLPPEGQKLMGQWTKETMQKFINQTYGSNSEIGKKVRAIVTNGSTNPADLVKYMGGLAGTVSVGPYISTIKFKGNKKVYGLSGYDMKLDSVDGGFASKVGNGFTQEDINKISSISNFTDIGSKQGQYFVEYEGKYFLTDEGINRFGLQGTNTSLEALGLDLAKVEDTKTLFKDKMKDLSNKNISNDTVDAVAESGAYDDVVDMIKEIVC